MRRCLVVATATLIFASSSSAVAQVAIDRTVRGQTWTSFQSTINLLHIVEGVGLADIGDIHPVPRILREAFLDDVVQQLGMTGLSMTLFLSGGSGAEPGIEPVNDNADPFVLDDSQIKWFAFDPYVRDVVVPMKSRVEARGEPFWFRMVVSTARTFHWREPASAPGEEYAEIVSAALLRMRDRFGVVPNVLSFTNEPNNGTVDPDALGFAIRALERRLRRVGLDVPFGYPDTSEASLAPRFYEPLARTSSAVMDRMRFLGFHGYNGSINGSQLRPLRDLALRDGLQTMQTEWWFSRDHRRDIITCLNESNAVVYEAFALGMGPAARPKLYGLTASGGTPPILRYQGFVRGANWHDIFHFARFIRPGDVRVGTASADARIYALAFEKPDGRNVLVLKSDATTDLTVAISGLASGRYGAIASDTSRKAQLLGTFDVTNGTAAVVVWRNGITTVTTDLGAVPVPPVPTIASLIPALDGGVVDQGEVDSGRSESDAGRGDARCDCGTVRPAPGVEAGIQLASDKELREGCACGVQSPKHTSLFVLFILAFGLARRSESRKRRSHADSC
ncbi:MAG: hypothetical protein HY791_24065 [Deltaproteobacteria bacterium]|nr:hypothetical protein [Deltaproteobacteria bacterium]